jgi:hypothetical protein
LKNVCISNGENILIELHAQGGGITYARVDAEGLKAVEHLPITWFASWYPSVKGFYCDGFHNGKHIRLHRVLVGASEGQDVDHINHDTLDNRRENLRIVNRAENMQNRIRPRALTASGALNVWWEEDRGKWRVMLRINGQRIHVGRFTDRDEAVDAATSARQKYMPFSQEAKEVLI